MAWRFLAQTILRRLLAFINTNRQTWNYWNYYSFAQEPSRTHQGKVSGSLGTIAWLVSSRMQKLVGSDIDATRSYAAGIMMAGLVPMLGLAAMLTLWPRKK